MISGRQRARGAQNGRYGGVGGYAGILHTSRATSSHIKTPIYTSRLTISRFSKFNLF